MRRRRSEIATVDEALKDVMNATLYDCPKTSNLALPSHNEWPHLQLLCVRHDFDDHVELYEQLQAINFNRTPPNGTPLPSAITYEEEVKATTCVTELADWIEANIPKLHVDTSTRTTREAHLKLLTDKAKEWKIGNCGELAAMCYLKIKALERAEVLSVEYVNLDDHALVVVNRAEGSPIDNPFEWGPNCYIVDAWQKESYQLQLAIDDEIYACSYIDLTASASFEVFACHRVEPPLNPSCGIFAKPKSETDEPIDQRPAKTRIRR